MKPSLKASLSLLFVALFLNACITDYKGREPDFTLKGAAAQAEYDRFHFEDGYWFQTPEAFTMGPEYKAATYRIKSLEPIIKEVSPESWDIYKSTRTLRQVGWYTLAAAAIIFVAAVSDGDGAFFSRDQTIAYYSLLGVTIGTSFVGSYYMSRAAERYNEDLKRKFTPSLSLNIGF